MSEFYAMKPSFFGKYLQRREALQQDAGLVEKIYSMQVDDLNDQYKRVYKIDGKQAIINIAGPLTPDGPDAYDVYMGYGGTAYKNIERAAAEARADFEAGRIGGVSVLINSPGGSVDGLDSAWSSLRGIADIATGYNTGTMASAALWLGSALDRVEPTGPTASAGSIGIVAVVQDYEGYLDMWGIREVQITNSASPNKRPDAFTADGLMVIRKELDDLYDVFVERVTATRQVTREQIDSLKGEMLIARRAVELGLMDRPQGQEPEAEDKTKNEGGNDMTVALTETVQDAQAVADPAPVAVVEPDKIEAERERIAGLLIVGGVNLADDLLTAIKTGTDVGAYAINRQLAAKAQADLEAETAKKLRQENRDKIGSVAGGQDDKLAKSEDEFCKLDALLDKAIKKGGK